MNRIKTFNISISDSINKIGLERIFVILGLILGIFYAIVIPPGQGPDEHAHWLYARNAFGFNTEVDDIGAYLTDIGYNNYYFTAEISQDKDLFISNMDKHFSKEARELVRMPSPAGVLKYLPAGSVMTVLTLLDVPIYWCLQISELGALLFFLVMGYQALKTIPVMKGMLFVILLMPMSLQQCISVNYDAVLLPVCFLLTSYILRLIFSAGTVGWKNVFFIAFMCLVILLIKPPYILIALLFFAIDKDKVKLNIGSKFELYSFVCRYRILIAVFLVIIMSAGIYVMRENEYIKLFYFLIKDFGKTIKLFAATFSEYGVFYLRSMVGTFGWMSMAMPPVYIILTYALLFMAAVCDVAEFNKKSVRKVRIASAAISVLIVIVIMLALLPWSFFLIGHGLDSSVSLEDIRMYFNDITKIEGVQGRYFIPLLPVIALTIRGRLKCLKQYFVIPQIIMFLGLCVWTCTALVYRFWC